MFRRVFLAVLLACSITLSGVSACESVLGDQNECHPEGEWCGYPDNCCPGLRCNFVPNNQQMNACRVDPPPCLSAREWCHSESTACCAGLKCEGVEGDLQSNRCVAE